MSEYNYNSSEQNTPNEDFNALDLLPLDEHLKKQTKTKLHKYMTMANICDDLKGEELAKIALKVIQGVEEDKQSQTKWMSDADEALKLSKLVKEPKNTPLPQSANIKFPLITEACHQFAARTYPELIQDGRIVKCEIVGKASPELSDKAERISQHMSYQLLGQDSAWETSIDKLLNLYSNLGCIFRKTYYDTINKKIVSDTCNYKDIIIRNDDSIQCLSDLRRITHRLYYHPNDLVENCRAGLFDEDAVYDILNYYQENQINPICEVYEQHRYLDLDDDGYEEPYIVTVAKDCAKVLRIVARYDEEDIQVNTSGEIQRIKPVQYFTDYHFLHSPDGSFMSYGFGTLLLHLNETINTIHNQLIDAGTLANLQTGFIDSRIKLMGGQNLTDPGQWNRVKGVIGQNLKDGIFPINYKEPSTVLFQLLGLLVQTGKDITSSTDAMQGATEAQNVPATTMLAMIEQGMKKFSSIQKRLYRSLKEEYQKIYRLNSKYLQEDEYQAIMGDPLAIKAEDYKSPALRVIPIADPNISSDAQRITQAQIIMSLAGKPGINTYEVYKRFLQAAKIPNIDLLLPPQQAQETNKPDPKVMDMQAKAKTKAAEVDIKARAQSLKEKEFVAKLSKIEAEITQMQANSIKLVADAASHQSKATIQDFTSKLEAVKSQIQAVAQAHSQMNNANVQHAQLQLDQQKVQNQHVQAMAQIQQNQQQLDQQAQEPAGDNNDGSNTGQNSG